MLLCLSTAVLATSEASLAAWTALDYGGLGSTIRTYPFDNDKDPSISGSIYLQVSQFLKLNVEDERIP